MGKILSFLAIIMILTAVQPSPSFAQNDDVKAIFNNSGLPLPRFISLRSDKVFVRTGPALRYPKKWIFTKKHLPVEIIQEFDTWRKIRDLDGEEGWIHQSLLSGARHALVTEPKGALLMRKPVTNAKPVVLLEPKVVVKLERCSGAWCQAQTNGFKGWIEKKSIWGVYETEELD